MHSVFWRKQICPLLQVRPATAAPMSLLSVSLWPGHVPAWPARGPHVWARWVMVTAVNQLVPGGWAEGARQNAGLQMNSNC